MKILHTADWHLGKRLDSFSRLPEQVAVMEEIVQIADEQAVDVVIVAGDLFDAFNPPVDAIDLFYRTLKRLSKDGHRPVIAIAGNHDAPHFIDAPNPLAKACGIILIGQPNAKVAPMLMDHFEITRSDNGFLEIKLPKYHYPIRIIHTAYANEQRLKDNLGENKEEQLNYILADKWNKLASQYCDTDGVNLLTTHLYMNKKGSTLVEEPDGEKPLKIGNATMIYSEAIPDIIQYTALGHIHKYMNIGTDERPVIYASSPLCYSFSEAGQQKYINIIEVSAGQQVAMQRIALIAGRPLYRMTFESIDAAVSWLTSHPDALVELTLVSDTFLTAENRKRIYQAHNGIIYLIPQIKADIVQSENNIQEIDLKKDFDTLFIDYFKTKNNNQVPNEDLMSLLNEIKNA